MSAPRLAAEIGVWRNRPARIKRRLAAALLASMGILALLIVGRQALLDFLQWMRPHALLCAGLAAFFSAVAVAQRRALKRAQFPRSWLAAVPVKSSTARWEAFVIETLPAGAALAVLCILAALAALALAFAQGSGFAAILSVWAYLSGGVVLGVGGSFLVPRPKPEVAPPGSRYVPKAKASPAAAIRASLSALGLWPIRQMFAWAQPKVVARATIPVLVMMPMGTTADAAMIVIAMFGVIFAMSLLWAAIISVSRAARGWLAPLPVGEAAVIRAFLFPAWSVIAAASAVGALLLLVFNVPYRAASAAGAIAAVVSFATTGLVLLWNVRPRRMP